MNRIVFLGVSALAACLLTGSAFADIYKCVNDSSNQVTYTNTKPLAGDKSCSLMTRDQPVSTVNGGKKPGASASPSPASFPKVDTDTQKSRDNDRRKILESELATETKALEDAKKQLAEQEAVRNGNEKNYQKYLDRVQQYKDVVSLHERNIEALNKELAKLR